MAQYYLVVVVVIMTIIVMVIVIAAVLFTVMSVAVFLAVNINFNPDPAMVIGPTSRQKGSQRPQKRRKNS